MSVFEQIIQRGGLSNDLACSFQNLKRLQEASARRERIMAGANANLQNRESRFAEILRFSKLLLGQL